MVVSAVALQIGLRAFVVSARNAEERLKNGFLLAAALLLSLLAADVAFTACGNFNRNFRVDQARLFEQRLRDQRVWDSELIPEQYRPTEGNFSLYKPSQERTATVYGELYYTGLLNHEILRDRVLEPQNVRLTIDRYGLRNDDDPASARIFALGDSFSFGYHTSQEATFPELLAGRLGEPVYNLGVSGTSPLQQFLILDYLLRTYPEAFRPRHLLWLIFEGNDLEGSYAESISPHAEGRGPRALFSGTIVGEVADIPALLRRQSEIRLLLSGNSFIRYVETLSDEIGFAHLDLNRLMAPFAEKELLYYRDDTHWNRRGHEVVSELLAHHVSAVTPN